MLEVENNDPKDIVIFDVNIHKKGFIPPKDFVNIFKNLHIPQVVYQGKFTEQVTKQYFDEEQNQFCHPALPAIA